MRKEDEKLLERVAKEKPELLEAEIEEELLHAAVGKLIKTPPAPKSKKRRRKVPHPNARTRSTQ